MERWLIVDNKTNEVVGTYASSKQAHRKADKLDLEYGAIRYIVVRESQRNPDVAEPFRTTLNKFSGQ